MNADTATAVHRFRVARDEDDPRVWLAEWLHTDADAVQVDLDVDLPSA